jgi:hypothetical protein
MVCVALLLQLASACEAAPGQAGQSIGYHRSHLAEGETAALGARLLAIPGYGYSDPTRREHQNALTTLRKMNEVADYLIGISIHHVVDERGGPMGRLWLWEWSPRSFPFSLDAESVPDLMAQSPSAREVIGGQPVFRFLDPQDPPNAYSYAWYRDGIMIEVEGADGDQIDAWVRAYLEAAGA